MSNESSSVENEEVVEENAVDESTSTTIPELETNDDSTDLENRNIIVEFSPHQNYPIYPTYATEVINGTKYKVYLETNWEQIVTEDGVSLKDLIQKLPVWEEPQYFNYKGYLRNSPKKSAMEKLLEIRDPQLLDIYLVERDYVFEGDYVSEIYSWYGNLSGWVYMGSTNPVGTIRHALPGILNLLPDDLGEPNDFLLVNEEGTGIIWANPLRDHNVDDKAHPDIRQLIEEIEISANVGKVHISEDTLLFDQWIYNPVTEYYEYDYSSENLEDHSYFEITPMIRDLYTAEAILKSGINPTYQIYFDEIDRPHAIIRSKTPPPIDIPVSIKVFGKVTEHLEDESDS